MSNQTSQRLFVKEPYEKWMRRGLLTGCALPIIAGLTFLWACYSLGFIPIVISVALVMCTLFTAFFAYCKFDPIAPSGFSKRAEVLLLVARSATMVQLVMGMLLFVIFFAPHLVGGFGLEGAVALLGIGGIYLLYHLIIWLIFTLPLSLLCGAMFSKVAMDWREADKAPT